MEGKNINFNRDAVAREIAILERINANYHNKKVRNSLIGKIKTNLGIDINSVQPIEAEEMSFNESTTMQFVGSMLERVNDLRENGNCYAKKIFTHGGTKTKLEYGINGEGLPFGICEFSTDNSNRTYYMGALKNVGKRYLTLGLIRKGTPVFEGNLFGGKLTTVHELFTFDGEDMQDRGGQVCVINNYPTLNAATVGFSMYMDAPPVSRLYYPTSFAISEIEQDATIAHSIQQRIFEQNQEPFSYSAVIDNQIEIDMEE